MKNLMNIKLTLIAVLTVASLSRPTPAWTQPTSLKIAALPPAPGTGTPDNERRGIGGSRPELTTACKQTAKPPTALVPEKGAESLTTAQSPTFWFYIPYAPKDIYSIEFSLHNEEVKKTIYRTFPHFSRTPGVIGIPLPPNPEYSLKVNEPYVWYFKVYCDPQNNITLRGQVTRVQLSPNLQGVIWHDELTNRATHYLSEPQNSAVKKAWIELLNSVGLEDLTQVPLVNSANSPNGT